MSALLASVIISTYNRSGSLARTLGALGAQDLDPDQYEVVVVNDGSTDDTAQVLSALALPCALKLIALELNSGVSAGRNAGLRAAGGDYVILLSDDVVVDPSFIRGHIRTLRAHPGCWTVGAFRQLDELTATPFGRYLDRLERQFEAARTGAALGDGLYAMGMPTARNLSLPRADLDRTGMFDPRFRVTCEDQDLAIRALRCGISFLYDTRISSLHNDHAADLDRYCQFQERGATDTVRLMHKHPEVVTPAAIVRVNGPLRRDDGAWLIAKKLVKSVIAVDGVRAGLRRGIHLAERAGLADPILFRAYRWLIGVHMFRGWRAGLADTGSMGSAP